MDKEDKQIIDRATKEEWRIGDRTRLKRLLEKNLELYRENEELKDHLAEEVESHLHAEEYRKSLKQRLIDEDDFERLEMFDKNVEEAFLAGLKAGRTQWHNLEKDPNDLPEKMVANPNFSIEVLSDRGEIVRYNFHYCEWFYWRSGKPIAWCEIPTFDKE